MPTNPCSYRLPHFGPLSAARPRHADVVRWERYLSRVYHQPVANAYIDLNTFSWFYLDAPSSDLECFHTCREAGTDVQTYNGTPWIGPAHSQVMGNFGRYGYFVRRPFPEPSFFERCTRLEVGHVHDGQHWSVGVSW